MKTKVKKILATIITLIFVICTLTACGANPEKSILGKWYNYDGDCLEIQSDNTYRTDFVEEIGKPLGSGSGKWVYLEEENLFKFYCNDNNVWEIKISKDTYGENFKYSYYGTFYKNEFPIEVIETMEIQKEASKKDIDVTVVFKDQTERLYRIKTDAKFLGDALLENGLITEEEYKQGYYTVIGGVKADYSVNKSWWCVAKEGEITYVSINDLPLTDGDSYEIIYTID